MEKQGNKKKKKRAPAKLFFGGTDGNEDSSKNQAPEPWSKRAHLALLLARKLKSVTYAVARKSDIHRASA